MGLIPFLSPISIVQQFGLVNMSQKLNFFKDFMLSGIAAGISKTAAAPIERVKLLVQNQDEMIKQGRLDKPYSGVMDCTKRTLAEEGITPFWRGNLANVIRYFPTQALNFAFEGQIKAIFNVPKDASYATKMSATIASGGIAGLYRGFAISCVGIFIYRGLYFGIYDTAKPIFIGEGGSFMASFLLGWAVTVVSGLASYPIDTIRRRMMMTSGTGVHYKSSMDCGMQILKTEGFMSMMKGAGANILRGVAGAGVLSGADEVKAFYIKMRNGQ